MGNATFCMLLLITTMVDINFSMLLLTTTMVDVTFSMLLLITTMVEYNLLCVTIDHYNVEL